MVVVTIAPLSLKFRLLELISEVVDVLPFTILVNSLTADVNWFWFTNSAVVVAITPFTFVVSSKELVEVEIVRVLLVMMEVVATKPLIFVVNTFPDADWVNEFMKLTIFEAIPFTNEVNELEVVAKELELIIVVVPTDPAMFEVKVFVLEIRELLIFKVDIGMKIMN